MAAIFTADLVKEVAVASGTGNFTLQGPATGFDAYGDRIPSGSLVPYTARQGTIWESGLGTLISATELSRDYPKASSASSGQINNQNPGTPTKASFDAGSSITIYCSLISDLLLLKDSAGGLIDGSPFRLTVFLASIASMKAQDGLTNGETVLIAGAGTLGGLFTFDSADATAPDNVDTFRSDNYATGLWKRIRPDLQGDFNGGVVVDASASAGGTEKIYSAKKASNANNWFGRRADASTSALIQSARLNQASEVDFWSLFSLGTNADRVAFAKPIVLPTKANAQGIKDKSVYYDSTDVELITSVADAADNATAADRMIIPRVKGTYLLGAYETISDLKAIDAAKYAKTNQRALVHGSLDGGDVPAFYVEWFPASSATADDAIVFRPSVGSAASGNGRWLRVAAAIDVTFTSGQATPSVKNGTFFVTAGTTTITDFLNEYEGQIITIQRGSANIVIAYDATKIDLFGRANRTLSLDSPRITLVSQGGVWREMGGADYVSPAVQAAIDLKASSVFVIATDYAGVDPTGATYSDVGLQNAITAAAGGTLYIPEGTYKLGASGSSRLYISSPCRIIGADAFRTIFKTFHATNDVLYCDTYYVTIEGIRFETDAAVTRTAGNYIHLHSCSQISIANFTMDKAYCGIKIDGGSLIFVGDGARPAFIRENWTSVGVGIHILGNPVSVYLTGVHMDNTVAPQCGIKISAAGDVTIDRCGIIRQYIDINVIPGNGEAVTSLWVINTYCDTATYGLNLAPTGTGVIARSHFINSWFSSHSIFGVRIEGGASSRINGLNFVNSQILFNTNNGFWVTDTTNVYDIAIDGGIFSSNASGIGFNGSIDKISITNAQIGAFGDGNNNSGYGLYVNGTLGKSVVANNIFDGNTSGNSQITTVAATTVIENNVGLVPAWTSFTPTVASVGGSITTVGAKAARYKLDGKTCHLEYYIPITTNGTGATAVTVSLPSGMTAAATFVLAGREIAYAGKMLQGVIAGTQSTISITNYDNTYPGADGVTLVVSGTIELA